MFLNLITELKRHNITRVFVAQKLGIDVNTLNNKIYGKTDFKLTEVNKILELFPNTSIDYLFKKEKQNK